MKIRNLLLTFVVCAISAFAADIDGTWSGSIETPGGALPVSFTFKADGDRLTGSTTGPDGSVITLNDGKIDGDKFSFNITIDFGGMPFTMAYTGELKEGGVILTAEIMGMPFQILLKKS
jgi:hypothetical protein